MQLFQTTVNTLHASLVDSQLGFKECASVVTDPQLKEKFEHIATKREHMIRELEIRGGADKSSWGTVKGSLSRAWTTIKSSFTSGQKPFLIDDIIKEEINLKKTYDNALKSEGCSSALNGLLFEHLKKIDCDFVELRGWSETKVTTEPTHLTTGEKIKEKMGQAWESTQATGEKLKAKMGFGETTQHTDKTVTQDQQHFGQHVSH